MSLKQLFVQTALTFVAAGLGAIFGAFLARRTERYKQLQGLRAAAYVDFLRGFAKVAITQNDGVRDERSFLEERDGMITMTDAKARIAIYGSEEVVHAVSAFISRGSQTHTSEGMRALTEVCELMRNEGFSERASSEDVNRLLFSS